MSLIGTCIAEFEREQWLAERRLSIGSSDAASILGIGYNTALHVYLEKLGLIEPEPENMAMRVGKLMEPVVAQLYRDQTGCEFASHQRFIRSPVHHFMTATLDCIRSDGRIVELKTVGARSAGKWGESGSDEVPHDYILQVLHQMVCSGTEVIDVAALIAGQDFRTYTIRRDDRIADHLISMEQEFWSRVQRRDPPRPDPDRDRRVMADLWPEAVGEMDFGPIGSALVEEWEFHKAEVRLHEKAKERCVTQILDMIEDRASATLHDGRLLVRKVISVEEKTVVTKPYRYVDLRTKTPRGGR